MPDPEDPDASPHHRLTSAVTRLAGWAHDLTWDRVDPAARDRFALLLHDTLAVTRAGSGLAENRALAQAWPAGPGPATALGHGTGPTERAAWLNGLAAVSLEMDCASRVTRGHAAAQSLFAVLAAAEERAAHTTDPADVPTAPAVLAGLLAAHEVASRFGRATTLRPGLHPHGSWGAAGAAAGAALVLGLDAAGTARAVDAAGGLLLAPPFSAALTGNPVRNHWVGHTNQAGLLAARAAAAVPDAPLTAPLVDAYAHALGDLDPAVLDAGLDDPAALGDGLALHTDFIKRHAACGYSHALLDAVLLLREDAAWPADPARITSVLLETNETSAELAGLRHDTRLAAMFSLDYLAAAAAVLGDTGPRATDADTREDPAVLALARRVRVEVAADLQAAMPLDRGGRVTVHVDGHGPLVAQVPNARWDPRHHPADRDDVRAKARALLDPLDVDESALFDWVTRATTTDGPLPPLGPVLGAPAPD